MAFIFAVLIVSLVRFGWDLYQGSIPRPEVGTGEWLVATIADLSISVWGLVILWKALP